jgi:NADH-quinone oxidoreductase subunit J
MIPDLILFFGLAFVAVASAIGMLASKNAVYSALNLILNFVTVSIFYLLLNAPFIALTQITVYAGAIMVLFLFVIMLLGAERLPGETTLPWQRPVAIILGVILFLETGYLLFVRLGSTAFPGDASAGFGSPAAIGTELFTNYLLPFEVTSVLLLVAMVGAIVLTQRLRKKKGAGV